MTIYQLYEKAEPYLKAIDKAVYREENQVKEIVLKAKWREIAAPEIGRLYVEAAVDVTTHIPTLLAAGPFRAAEAAFAVSLGSGLCAPKCAQELTDVIMTGALIETLGQDAAFAVARYLTDVRLLAQIADADSGQSLGTYCNQIDCVDATTIDEVLVEVFHHEAKALGRAEKTTKGAIEHLVAAGEDRFAEAPGLVILRWAYATGYLEQHAAKIQSGVSEHQARGESFAAEFVGAMSDLLA